MDQEKTNVLLSKSLIDQMAGSAHTRYWHFSKTDVHPKEILNLEFQECGPEHPVLLQRFRKRFRGQDGKGFFGMSIFEVEGLLGGIGSRRKKRKEPKTIDREGYSIIG